MKYYFTKLKTETFNDVFDGTKFTSVIDSSKEKAIRRAEKFKKWMENNFPNDRTDYELFTLTIEKVNNNDSTTNTNC
jgi:hypothetical protein